MTSRKSAKDQKAENILRVERLADAIGPLQDELYIQVARLAPLLGRPSEFARLAKLLSPPKDPRKFSPVID